MVAEALIEIVILLGFLAIPGLHDDQGSELQVLEFFAGAARTARLAKGVNLKSAALDKTFHSSMDINTPAGFLLLAIALYEAH